MFSSTSSRGPAYFIAFLLLLAICFETLQQLYYINRYNLAEGVTFMDVLQGQAYRWIIWLLLGLGLLWYALRKGSSLANSPVQFIRHALFVVSLVLLNVLLISIIEMIKGGDGLSWALFTQEYFPFFIYQKAPMYTLGYIAVAVVLQLYVANRQLQIEIQQLHDIKETHQQRYEELRSRLDDRTSILSIKIGNKRRIIPVNEVLWIEADDYCVKVHTQQNAYTMRSSLKALEKKLEGNFLRVHRGALVNMDCTQELRLSKTPHLVLSDQTAVQIAKSQLKSVRAFLS